MIYIVIPVHNRRELTYKCLASLSAQNMDDYKIIVVDDGSTDGTNEMIRQAFPNVIVLEGDGNLWWAGAINKGIRHAQNDCQPDDYILTLNDDLVVKPDYLSNLLAAAQGHPHAIIGSVETTEVDPDRIKKGGIHVNWKTAKVTFINQDRLLDDLPPNLVIPVSRLTGRGTLYPCEVFSDVGVFDDIKIKQCADTELPVKANFKYGYSLFVAYGAVVISHVSKKQDINSKLVYSLKDGKEYFFGIRSHYNLMNRYWIARRIAPNFFWFIRFWLLENIRTIGHYLIRLRFHQI